MEVLWDYRVVLDLFLGGAGIGAFLFGAILFYISPEKYGKMIKSAWIIAPVLIIAGLLILITELGRPYNILKTLINVNPTSFMSIGIFLQGLCVLFLALLAMNVLTKSMDRMPKALVYVAAIFAGLVGLYHGFLLTGIERAPWNTAVPLVFFLSSILAGSSLVILLSSNTSELQESITTLKLPVAFNMVLTLEVCAVLAWVYALTVTSAETKLYYDALVANFSLEFWVLSLLIGLIAPLGILTMSLLNKIEGKTAFLASSLCIVTGSFFLKHLFVYLGQAV